MEARASLILQVLGQGLRECYRLSICHAHVHFLSVLIHVLSCCTLAEDQVVLADLYLVRMVSSLRLSIHLIVST